MLCNCNLALKFIRCERVVGESARAHVSADYITTCGVSDCSCALGRVDSGCGRRHAAVSGRARARMHHSAEPCNGDSGGDLSDALEALRCASRGSCWRHRLEGDLSRLAADPGPSGICGSSFFDPRKSGFVCPACGDVLQHPVTAICGHTCCKSCSRPNCPACGAYSASNSDLSINVLVQNLVERWWSAELLSARAAHDAERLLLCKGDPDSALGKCNRALDFTPRNHKVLAVRSQVLNSMNRLSDSLLDADTVVRLRPTWSKGHFVRGIVLSNISRHEEALISFCVSASLGYNAQAIRKHVTLCLARLLTSNRLKRCRRSIIRTGRANKRRISSSFSRSRLCKCHVLKCRNESTGGDPTEEIALCNSWETTRMNEIIDKIFCEVRKYLVMAPSATELQVETILVYQSDFECVLCSQSLLQPVTTPCGHTYCMHCLETCLDYSSACPLCMTSLSEYLANNSRSITTFIDEAMRNFIPMEYLARKISHTQENIGTIGCEPHVPVFVCTTAFPTVPCPLFVFEPRYRVMVRRCLESGTRQFGIAACLDKNLTGPNRYAEFGTLLEIKDCVLMGNGCSILSTVGVNRFRVLARGERDGYDIAKVETVEDIPILRDREMGILELHNTVRRKAWLWFKEMDEISKSEIVQTFGAMPDEEEHWMILKDGPSWTWWIVAILPLGSQLKVMILANSDLEKRLRAIDRTLDYIYFLAKQQKFTFTGPPSNYYRSPWIYNQTASTSQLGEQSM